MIRHNLIVPARLLAQGPQTDWMARHCRWRRKLWAQRFVTSDPCSGRFAQKDPQPGEIVGQPLPSHAHEPDGILPILDFIVSLLSLSRCIAQIRSDGRYYLFRNSRLNLALFLLRWQFMQNIIRIKSSFAEPS